MSDVRIWSFNENGLAPGVIETDMWGDVDALFAKYKGLEIGQKKREVGLAVPYGRMGNWHVPSSGQQTGLL